jgi:hypothetical protein
MLGELSAALWVDQHAGPEGNPMRAICQDGDHDALARAAEADPIAFCAEALKLLRGPEPAAAPERLVRVLLESDVLLAPLCDPLSFSRAKALKLASLYATVQPQLAGRTLARMLASSGRSLLPFKDGASAPLRHRRDGRSQATEEGLCLRWITVNRASARRSPSSCQASPCGVVWPALLLSRLQLRAIIEGFGTTKYEEARTVIWDAPATPTIVWWRTRSWDWLSA